MEGDDFGFDWGMDDSGDGAVSQLLLLQEPESSADAGTALRRQLSDEGRELAAAALSSPRGRVSSPLPLSLPLRHVLPSLLAAAMPSLDVPELLEYVAEAVGAELDDEEDRGTWRSMPVSALARRLGRIEALRAFMDDVGLEENSSERRDAVRAIAAGLARCTHSSHAIIPVSAARACELAPVVHPCLSLARSLARSLRAGPLSLSALPAQSRCHRTRPTPGIPRPSRSCVQSASGPRAQNRP